MSDLTAAVARAVSELHEPMPTALGVDACAHCTALRQVHIIRWPCPTRKVADQHADEAAEAARAVSVAGRIEAEECRIRRLTPGDDSWESPDFRAGMLHAAAIVRAEL